jgi:hypothetical protein
MNCPAQPIIRVKYGTDRAVWQAFRKIKGWRSANRRTIRARHWRAILDERAGRFPAVLGWAATEAREQPHDRPAVASLTGFVLLANARFPGVVEHFERAVEAAGAGRSPMVEALRREHLAWAVAWTDPERARDLASQALPDLNRRVGSPIDVGRSLAATALADVGAEAPEAVLTRTRESLEVIERTGYRADALHPLLVELLLHCVSGNADAARAARRHILALIDENDTHVYLRDVTAWWIGEPTVEGAATWLDGEGDARRRWLEVLENRRAGHRTSRRAG